MKKFLTLFLAVIFAAALFPATAFAETLTWGNYEYEKLTNGTIRITKYNSTAYYDVEIPSKIPNDENGWQVAEIREGAFEDHGEIRTLIIPDSVKSIGYNAFSGCYELRTVSISNNLEMLGSRTFNNCWRLESITLNGATPQRGLFVLPDSLEEIWNYAFYNCDGLINIKLPSNLKILRTGAFEECDSLLEVNIPGTVKDIYSRTFKGCDSLQKAVLNEGTLNIFDDWWAGTGAFEYCPKLTEVHIPASVAYIDGYTFYESPNVVIHCAKNSYAYKWAEDNNIKIFAPLMAPTGVPQITSATSDKTSATLKWDGVDGVSGYEVYRSIDGSNFDLMVATTHTSWKNEGLTPDTTYYYKVLAYNESGGNAARGSFSKVKTVVTDGTGATTPGTTTPGTTKPGSTTPGATTPGTSKIAAPAGIKAVASGADKTKVSWNAVGGARGYELQVSTNGKTYKSLPLTSGKSYTHTKLTPGTKYYYRVRAYKMSGGKKVYGAYSKVASVTLKLSSPKSARAAAIAGGSAKITWGGVAGASGYVVERSTSKTRGFKPVKTATAKTFTDKKLKKGATYYYRVRAYRNSGGKKVYGAYSAVFSVKAK